MRKALAVAAASTAAILMTAATPASANPNWAACAHEPHGTEVAHETVPHTTEGTHQAHLQIPHYCDE